MAVPPPAGGARASAQLSAQPPGRQHATPFHPQTPAKRQGALESPSTWNITAFLNGDALAAEVATNGPSRSLFFYSHHTWSHQNLDNTTLFDAQVQIQLNKRIADAVRQRERFAGSPLPAADACSCCLLT
jgi:hypothetical protein